MVSSDDPDVHAELRKLTQRVDEQVTLQRTMRESLTTLTKSVATVVDHHQKGGRALHINSFVAYLLFTLLLGGAFWGLYRANINRMSDDRDEALGLLAQARGQLQDTESLWQAREAGASAALAFYRLLETGKHEQAIARYPELQNAQLTATERAHFAHEIKRAKSQIVDAGYLAGLDLYRKKNYTQANVEFARAVSYADDGARTALVRYYYGVSLLRTDKPKLATRQLELALAGGAHKQASGDDARYHLADALFKIGRVEDAKNEYTRFVSAHPNHMYTWVAKRKILQLSRAVTTTN